MSEYKDDPAPRVRPAFHDVVAAIPVTVLTLLITKADDVPFHVPITDSNTPAVTVEALIGVEKRYWVTPVEEFHRIMPPPLEPVGPVEDSKMRLFIVAVIDSCATAAAVIGCAIDGNVAKDKLVEFAEINTTHGRELPHDGRSSGWLPAVACETVLPLPV